MTNVQRALTLLDIEGFVRTGNDGSRGSIAFSSLRACGSKNSLNLITILIGDNPETLGNEALTIHI